MLQQRSKILRAATKTWCSQLIFFLMRIFTWVQSRYTSPLLHTLSLKWKLKPPCFTLGIWGRGEVKFKKNRKLCYFSNKSQVISFTTPTAFFFQVIHSFNNHESLRFLKTKTFTFFTVGQQGFVLSGIMRSEIGFCCWFIWTTCRTLAPRPGIKPVPPTVEVWSLNHWTAT